jgi:fructose-1,6-bisphosphatase/inositol monophosphatase family enzyme
MARENLRNFVDNINPVLEKLFLAGANDLTIDTASLALIGASRVLKFSPLFGTINRPDLDVQVKSFDQTLVTRGDHASQNLITHFIDQKYPDSTIWGEEEKIRTGTGKIEFMFDPLDGTGMLPAGVGASTAAVMASIENKPMASAIVDPFQNSMVVAQEGKVWAIDLLGRKLEGRRMKQDGSIVKDHIYLWHDTTLRKTTVGRLASLLTGLVGAFPGHDFTELSTGSNINNQAALCRSMGDLQITDAIGGPWDILIGANAIQQAGGVVTDLKGKPVTKETKDGILSASNPEIYGRALAVVTEVFNGYKNFREG